MSDGAEPISDGSDGDRDRAGRFKKGWKGGPGGSLRPHGPRLAKAILESDIDSAVKVLRDIMMNDKAKDADRISAARELLDRGAGRVPSGDLTEAVDQLEAMVEKLMSEKSGSG